MHVLRFSNNLKKTNKKPLDLYGSTACLIITINNIIVVAFIIVIVVVVVVIVIVIVIIIIIIIIVVIIIIMQSPSVAAKFYNYVITISVVIDDVGMMTS